MRQGEPSNENLSLTEQMSIVSDVQYIDEADSRDFHNGLFSDESNETSRHRGKLSKRSIVLIVLASIFLLIVLVIGGMFARYAHTAAPGVSIAGQSVTGSNEQQLRSALDRLLDNTKVKIHSPQDKSVTISIRQLGVKVPVDHLVKEALTAKSNPLVRLFPWVKKDILITSEIDEDTLGSYIGEQFITPENRATPSSLHYDNQQKKFVVDPGKDGSVPQIDAVIRAVHEALSHPGKTINAELSYRDSAMPISVESAQEAVDKANVVLGTSIVVSNGSEKKVTIAQDRIASWISTTSNDAKGTISIALDADLVRGYITDELAKELSQEMVAQQDIVDNRGNVLISDPMGKDGIEIDDTNGLAAQILEALQGHKSREIRAVTKVKKFEIKQVVAPMRIVIDKATQRLAAYRDGKLQRAFNVVTGSLRQQPSPTGTFVVKGHETAKTLISGDNAYALEDAQWILTLNNGTYIFGSAGEVPGIKRGDPITFGFAGSVALSPEDAKWLYDNSPEGTVVQIYGEDPYAPVRPK